MFSRPVPESHSNRQDRQRGTWGPSLSQPTVFPGAKQEVAIIQPRFPLFRDTLLPWLAVSLATCLSGAILVQLPFWLIYLSRINESWIRSLHCHGWQVGFPPPTHQFLLLLPPNPVQRISQLHGNVGLSQHSHSFPFSILALLWMKSHWNPPCHSFNSPGYPTRLFYTARRQAPASKHSQSVSTQKEGETWWIFHAEYPTTRAI